MATDAETTRLTEAREQGVAWRKWGPYLSERQWGTVREDYSADGDAWDYFTHDQARSRAYGWGEDGLAGFSDDKQQLCFALALWNGADPILKERLFGLTNGEGNHGEDVKEYYFYLDSTPTHSYMQWLYKYPQRAYPYEDLVRDQPGAHAARARVRAARHRRLRRRPLLRRRRRVREGGAGGRPDPHRGRPTGAPSRRRCTSCPRCGSATPGRGRHAPEARRSRRGRAAPARASSWRLHETLGQRWLSCEGTVPLLFTENETNQQRLFGAPNASPYVKDGINDHVVRGRADAVNPAQTGTKAAAHYRLEVPAGEHDGAAPPAARRGAGHGRRVRRLRRHRGPAAEGGRRVLRHHHAAVAVGRRARSSCARRSRACCGASSTTSSTSTRGSRATAPIR